MKHIRLMMAAAVVAMGCAWNVAAGPDTNTLAIYLGKSSVAVTAIKNGAFYPGVWTLIHNQF